MGEFYIQLEKGTMASHLIKIRGIFKQLWGEELRDYIKRKIDKEINAYYEAELELLKIEKNKVEVWVLIATVGRSETIREWAKEWLEKHIDKNIADIISLEVEPVSPLSRMMNGV